MLQQQEIFKLSSPNTISKDLRKFWGERLKLNLYNSVKSKEKSKNYGAKFKVY